MATLLKRTWWVVLLQGLVAVLFGVLALVWPGLTLATLVLLFGAYALVDGAFAVVGSLVHRKEYEDWWLVLLTGLVSIAVGILTFIQPGITAMSLLFLIAAWALVDGVLTIVKAIQLRKEIEPIVSLPREVATRAISIQEKIEQVRQMLLERAMVNFAVLLKTARSKVDVIVTASASARTHPA